jgi:hypothetical protein
MKNMQPSIRVLTQRRDGWMKKLAEVGPSLRGSLCSVKRGKAIAHQLTVSINGKTHTVYVPVDKVDEVEQWIKNYKRTQRILKEISKLNMALIHRHVTEKRNKAKAQKPTPE